MACTAAYRQDYYKKNSGVERNNHEEWRRKHQGDSEEIALAWVFKRRMSGIIRRSKRKRLEIDITPAYLLDVFRRQKGLCYYSGDALNWRTFGSGKARSWDGLSVDRLDGSKGYVKGNVVLCCYAVNTMKLLFSEEGFYAMCEKILSVRKQRGDNPERWPAEMGVPGPAGDESDP